MVTHGTTKSGEVKSLDYRLYYIWCDMKTRCYNNKEESYKYYGDKGVIVCKEWIDNYPAFRDWSYRHGYKEHLHIDRINHDGIYEASNCRWGDTKEQDDNKSPNHWLTAFGETKSVMAWSKDVRCKVKFGTLSARIRNKWQPEKAISQPVKT